MTCAYRNLSSAATLYGVTPVKTALRWLTTRDKP